MTCTYCGQRELVLVPGDFPWTIDHLQCPECDSTYNIDEMEEGHATN